MKHVFRGTMVVAAGLAVLWAGMALAGPTDADKCYADKIKRAGWYNFCRMKAESKGVKKSEAPDFTKCDYKITEKFGKAETKWGAECPTSGDVGDIQEVITDDVACLTALLAGTTAAECPRLPATGQTTCWDSSGSVIPCFGTGHDGDIQAGRTLAYVDNGDGTITDLNTGLMWEKKSDDGSIHDKDSYHSWDNAFAVHVAGLNGANFAGHSDWRLPNLKELQSIVNYENWNPAVSPAFNTGCTPGCTVATCSCTKSTGYWSSTTIASGPFKAWFVFFYHGDLFSDPKGGSGYVRAVRGGL